MNDDLLKELSRLQLLTSRYNSKSKMCPFEIKKEEVKAKLIFDYIKQLQQENKELKERIDKAIEYMKSIENEPDYDSYYDLGDYKEYKELLNILEGDK